MTGERYLVIDTETSGLLLFDRPADGFEQGRLAQLAMIECEPGPGFEITRKVDFYVKPDGWLMSPAATEVNGLTIEFLEENGIPVAEVLDAYTKSVLSGRTVVTYNAQFDCKVLRGELRRAGRDDLFERTPNICLMRTMTPVCKLPQMSGKGRRKWPRLHEAMAYFDLPFEETHKAVNDVAATYDLMRKINEIGALRDGIVHYARSPSPKDDE